MMIDLLVGVYWFDEALQRALKGSGWPALSRTQSLLLINVANGEQRPSRLAKNLGISRQSMSEMLADLRDRNILDLLPDPTDRRALVVEFDPRSEVLRQTVGSILGQLEKELRERLGGKTYDAMAKGLSSNWGTRPEVKTLNANKAEANARSAVESAN